MLASATHLTSRALPSYARMDVINAFDEKYRIRDGTLVGVGASQYGAQRGYFIGLARARFL